jgi:hypothetical protein
MIAPALQAIIEARFSEFGDRCAAIEAAHRAGHTLREICAADTVVAHPAAAGPERWLADSLEAYDRVTRRP